MADTEPKAKRRIRESTETMRERSERTTAINALPVKQGALKRSRGWLGGLGIWKPLRVVGRLVAKYIIPPYFRNSARELKMVTWPNRKTTRQLSVAVMIFAIIFGVIVAVVDYGLDKVFKKVILNQ